MTNDLELSRALADLAPLHSDGEPVVTLYLDTRWSDEKQRERARVFVEDAMRQAVARHAAHPQRTAMERTLGRIAEEAARHAEQARDGAAHGLAVFGCEALGLWRVLEVARPFADELSLDGRPHLLQLARLADEVQPALVACVHGRGAQLYALSLGSVTGEATVERDVPTQHGQGGRVRGGASPSPHGASGGAFYEREQKNQRHAEEAVERLHREAADLLRRLWEREPRRWIVLVGTSEVVASLERLLPGRMRAKVLARLPRPPSEPGWAPAGRDALVDEVTRRVVEQERRDEADQVEHAIGEALRGGLAVLGPEDVVLAVNERRVHRLFVEEDFEGSGWRCRNCGALGATHDEVCAFCQGPLARVEALGEELIGRVLADDGEVEVVAHGQRLHAYHGVAALLRQAHASGLAGGPPAAGD